MCGIPGEKTPRYQVSYLFPLRLLFDRFQLYSFRRSALLTASRPELAYSAYARPSPSHRLAKSRYVSIWFPFLDFGFVPLFFVFDFYSVTLVPLVVMTLSCIMLSRDYGGKRNAK